MKVPVLISMAILSFGSLFTPVNGQKELKYIQIPVATVTDRIRGGMLGQIIGNLNGGPHEFKYIGEPGNVEEYTPALPDGAWTDDDTDFEWVYIFMMQKYRLAMLPADTICSLWKNRINRNIWCANRYARYLMDIGIEPPFTGYTALNPWSGFNISGQFLCETFGLIAPAMPQTAARTGLNYTTVAISGEPAQTTQLFTTMISTAFIRDDMDAIINDGVAALDENSNIRTVIADVRRWYAQNPDNWRETRKLLAEKYTHENNNMRDINGSELNTGSIIAALLYGHGDFRETLRICFNFGYDADCTAATCGTILGVIKGYRWIMSQGWQIVDRYRNTTRDYMPMDETITGYADRLIDLFEMINTQNGGKTEIAGNVKVFDIPAETPGPVIHLKSVTDQGETLLRKLTPSIAGDLQNGNRVEKARAAYLAVCLGLNGSLAAKYPKQWKEAAYDLSGYWKVMNNIFSSYNDSREFSSLKELREKFMSAGFKPPLEKIKDEELYKVTEAWKDPGEIY